MAIYEESKINVNFVIMLKKDKIFVIKN